MCACLSPDHICSSTTIDFTLWSLCYYLHLMCCSCFQWVFYSFTAAVYCHSSYRMRSATILNELILTHILYVSNSPLRITLSCDYHDKNRHAPCNILIYMSAERIENATLNVAIANSLSFNWLAVFTTSCQYVRVCILKIAVVHERAKSKRNKNWSINCRF